ncbi:uncharacterized protein LOC115444343 [Manduca sexta]|uniref:Uncharacterized protein n=1 Tax=Manduca sexta TaxID=7130 RepID=A0A921Z4R2_MANSE|nr:uncharacterized protein LOC115444343 [Manduca sexta]KAG6451349.1 hypothetical protein O3G_MSEX007075 [Manduca sexta]
MNHQYSLDSESDYEVCPLRANSCALPFDPTNIENIILSICDNFDFKVILNDNRAKGALLITTGLALAGGLIGRHYGGKVGAMIGGAVGGGCGLGIVAVSMREIWQDVKEKLSELFDIVYDYLAGLGLDDYRRAAMFLTNHSGTSAQLAMVILETASSILGKQITSRLAVA